MMRLRRISSFFLKLIAASIVSKMLYIMNKKYRHIWIISERGDDARDNGYFFYKYICEQHPEIDIYYIIKSESADFNKIKSIGEWIEYGSFKHFIFYKLAQIRISSSMWGGDLPCADYFYKLRKYMSRNKKFVFLKHGIVKDYLPQHSIDNSRPDIYICGAAPEYEYVLNNFGHPKHVIQYTGLARFDNLHNIRTNNQILIMPTFRMWLQSEKSLLLKKANISIVGIRF